MKQQGIKISLLLAIPVFSVFAFGNDFIGVVGNGNMGDGVGAVETAVVQRTQVRPGSGDETQSQSGRNAPAWRKLPPEESCDCDGIGPVIQKQDWSGGWTTAELYTVGRETYLFLLKSGSGSVHIHRMNGDGTIGPQIQEKDWSGGWTTAELYTVGRETYLFLLKSGSGSVHIHRVNGDGTIGPQSQETNLSAGWTTAEFYTVDRETYLLLLDEGTGRVQIRCVRTDGSIGPVGKEQDLSGNWTRAAVFKAGRETYLFLIKAADGAVQIRSMPQNRRRRR